MQLDKPSQPPQAHKFSISLQGAPRFYRLVQTRFTRQVCKSGWTLSPTTDFMYEPGMVRLSGRGGIPVAFRGERTEFRKGQSGTRDRAEIAKRVFHGQTLLPVAGLVRKLLKA